MLQTLPSQQWSIAITNHKVEQRCAGVEGSDTEDSSTPTLRINLLGTFQLDLDNTPAAGIDLPRLRSLLAYLALHRWTPLSRSYLASLFWPDSTDAQAHTNLRNLIHKLRQGFPGKGMVDTFIRSDWHMLQWQPTAPWTLDVLEFEQAITRAEQARLIQDIDAEKQALEEAVSLYRGELLPGCYDEWILPERDRLQQIYLGALERLIDLLKNVRGYYAAISIAQRLLRHDPLHESAYRRLMRLYASSGNRAAALRTYQNCVVVLERELGVEPSAATQALYDELIQAKELKQLTSPLILDNGVYANRIAEKA
jgi:DNA-binding SARP family transcriptional activator